MLYLINIGILNLKKVIYYIKVRLIIMKNLLKLLLFTLICPISLKIGAMYPKEELIKDALPSNFHQVLIPIIHSYEIGDIKENPLAYEIYSYPRQCLVIKHFINYIDAILYYLKLNKGIYSHLTESDKYLIKYLINEHTNWNKLENILAEKCMELSINLGQNIDFSFIIDLQKFYEEVEEITLNINKLLEEAENIRLNPLKRNDEKDEAKAEEMINYIAKNENKIKEIRDLLLKKYKEIYQKIGKLVKNKSGMLVAIVDQCPPEMVKQIVKPKHLKTPRHQKAQDAPKYHSRLNNGLSYSIPFVDCIKEIKKFNEKMVINILRNLLNLMDKKIAKQETKEELSDLMGLLETLRAEKIDQTLKETFITHVNEAASEMDINKDDVLLIGTYNNLYNNLKALNPLSVQGLTLKILTEDPTEN